MTQLTILRTGAGSAVAPFVIRALRNTGARVIAADMNALSVGFAFADRALRIPPARSSEFVPALLEACRTEHVDVLFPDVDEELLPVARARDSFEQLGVRVLLSPADVLERCMDKHRFAAELTRLGLPAPRILTDEELAGDLTFPLFIKPRLGRGSSQAHKVRDRAHLDALLQRVPGPVVQEFLGGREYTIDTLSTLDGRFLYASVRERLATDSGISVKGRTLSWPRMEELARRVVEGLGIIGPCCLQAILDSSGEPRFTDCNPRLGGGTVLSIAAGAPILDDLMRLVRGESTLGKAAYRPGLVMLRSWQETFIDPIENVKAVAFDLDETLYDRREHFAAALEGVAATVAEASGGDPKVLADRLISIWRRLGSDHDHIFDTWLGDLGLPVAEHLRRAIEAFHAYKPTDLRLRPGVQEALAALRARGIPTAIVTDGRATTQTAKVTTLGLEALVDQVVYCGALGAAKPDPAALVDASQRLGVPTENLLLVGDHPRYDVVMARRAGAISARVYVGEFANRPDDPEASPDITAADIPELARILLRRIDVAE
jgi:carbamoyl-phosphate synthase large subunit